LDQKLSNYSEESILNYLGPYKGEASAILRSLQLVQELLGYVPDSAIDLIAKNCNVSRAEVYGVFTFYSDFRSTPPAQVVVKVCVAEACQASGNAELISKLHGQGYDIHSGKIKDDIQMEQTFCLGNCALGPAAMVNGKPIGRATSASILKAAAELTS
jgi:formate dehydrogenase subunit gamma